MGSEATSLPEDVSEAVLRELEKDKPTDDTHRDMELSLWDFAGQELYYVTHQVMLMLIVSYSLQ